MTLLLAVSGALACLNAQQSRLFPVGLVGDAVVALQVEQLRGEGDAGAEWYGQARLVRAGSGTVASYPEFTEGLGAPYVARLGALLVQASASAKAIPGFVAAIPTSHVTCSFSADVCGGQRNPTRSAWVPELAWVAKYRDGIATPGALWGASVGAVRAYRAAARTFTVVTVGAGPHEDGAGDTGNTKLIEENGVAQPVAADTTAWAWDAVVPHHGFTVDVVVR